MSLRPKRGITQKSGHQARLAYLLEQRHHRCPRLQRTGQVITVSSIAGDAGFTLLHDAWQVKKTLEKTISDNRIDQYYERALDAGVLFDFSFRFNLMRWGWQTLGIARWTVD